MANEGEAAAAGLLDGPLDGDRLPVVLELEPLRVVQQGHLHHGIPAPPVPVARSGTSKAVS